MGRCTAENVPTDPPDLTSGRPCRSATAYGRRIFPGDGACVVPVSRRGASYARGYRAAMEWMGNAGFRAHAALARLRRASHSTG
jgi:hypothetical protein